jgi:hypothetical protein
MRRTVVPPRADVIKRWDELSFGKVNRQGYLGSPAAPTTAA